MVLGGTSADEEVAGALAKAPSALEEEEGAEVEEGALEQAQEVEEGLLLLQLAQEEEEVEEGLLLLQLAQEEEEVEEGLLLMQQAQEEEVLFQHHKHNLLTNIDKSSLSLCVFVK